MPEYRKYLRDDGTMIVQLTKAMYGCVESAKLWYESIKDTLSETGFERNVQDHCVFNNVIDGKQITIC